MPGPERNPNHRHRDKQVPIEPLPEEGRLERVPAPPRRRNGEGPWPKWLMEWWRAAWRSPMAVKWDPATDRFPLGRLARLMERDANGEITAAVELTEMRQLETNYGLSPKGRKELHWRLGAAEAEPPAEAKPPAKPDQSKRRLRVLKLTEGDQAAS